MKIQICVFDAYGTLFDVGAAVRDAAREEAYAALAEQGAAIAETWRQKQLGYSWLRAGYGCHTDFWTVTSQALDYALEAHGFGGDEDLRARLLQLYWELSPYDEVQRVLQALKAAGMRLAILSNGAPDMLEAAVESAKLGEVFDAILSAEQVGVFKPAPAVYELVEQSFGVARREVLFVSSNGWDACCATGFGFRTLWVNRQGEPLDRMPWRPEFVAETLTRLPKTVETL
ncbi:MAG: haloacid dehalogenase type II [Pseudomonadota bacterium]